LVPPSARTVSLLTSSLAGRTSEPPDPDALVRSIAVAGEDDLLAGLSSPMGWEWQLLVQRVKTEARRQLVSEFGNPDPHRLA
jgi:hypothetical protein